MKCCAAATASRRTDNDEGPDGSRLRATALSGRSNRWWQLLRTCDFRVWFENCRVEPAGCGVRLMVLAEAGALPQSPPRSASPTSGGPGTPTTVRPPRPPVFHLFAGAYPVRRCRPRSASSDLFGVGVQVTVSQDERGPAPSASSPRHSSRTSGSWPVCQSPVSEAGPGVTPRYGTRSTAHPSCTDGGRSSQVCESKSGACCACSTFPCDWCLASAGGVAGPVASLRASQRPARLRPTTAPDHHEP